MLKQKYILGFLISLSLMLGSPGVPVAAQTPAGGQLRLVSTDAQGIVLELTVDGFEVETLVHDGHSYQRLIIPGMGQTNTPGQPQVPTRGVLLGLPSNEGVTLEVLEADYETLSGYRLYPAPRLEVTGDNVDQLALDGVQQVFSIDREAYATNAFYPDRLAEIGYTGYMRDQAVAQVQFYPLQYNPVNEQVRLYHRILARVRADMTLSVTAVGGQAASPPYEALLESALLNYSTLTRPPVLDDTSRPAPGSEVIVADNGPTLKIGVTEDGLYQLTPNDLTAAGLDLSGVLLSIIKIRNRGAEIPIYVSDSNGNNAFDANDYILFYGTAVDDMYTFKNVYWLQVSGTSGQRMAARDGTPSGGTLPGHFPDTLHMEEDSYYWQGLPNGEGQDHWFWGSRLSAPESRDYNFSVNNISTTAGAATVRVRLRGYSANEHRSRLYLNSVQIDDRTWSGQVNYTHQVSISHSLLNQGSNTLRVEAVGSALNQFFVNWFEIDYRDGYVAENNQLWFGAPSAGTFQFEVTGFQSNPVEIFDITNPNNVMRIVNATVTPDGANYRLLFRDTAQAETRYLALGPGQRKSPTSIELDEPSSWMSTNHGADYIIITYERFYTETQRLADHRTSMDASLRVVRVKVDDIYDEFNHGIFNPGAIRDFLSYTYQNWQVPAPSYVLLVGDAYYDYKDNLKRGIDNYVPSQVVETPSIGQTASDNWYVAVNGSDILPDMFIGRLTPRSVSQASSMIDKIIYYDQNPPGTVWSKRVLLVADDDSDDFEITSEQLADRLPFNYTANRVYARNYPPDVPRTAITNYINSGSVLVNYAGHGSVSNWGWWDNGGQYIFTSNDVDALSNTYMYPFVTIADCLNGYFVSHYVSMAERFLQQTGKGALAVWASTGLGYPSGHRAMLGALYDAIFQDDVYGLGEATTLAKVEAYYQNPFAWGEFVETFVLFGDPAQDLGIPPNYPYLESTTPANGASQVPLDQDIQIVFNRPMNPASVQLSGPATGLSPGWNADHTIVTYDHNQFAEGQTLSFTIQGEDQLGKQVGVGPVPNPWSFTTVYLRPAQVSIVGPTQGITQTEYLFTASVGPGTVVTPITYEWQADGQDALTHSGGGLSDTASFTWTIAGAKTVTVTVTNAYGSAIDGHVISIGDMAGNSVYLPIVVKNN